MSRDIWKEQRGQAIPVALLVLVVVVILGFSLYDFSQNDQLLVGRNQDAKQAEYLARAGVDAAKDWWRQQDPKPIATKAFDRIYLTQSGDYVLSDPGTSKLGYTDVNITYTSGTNNKWTVTSTAVVNDAKREIHADSTSLVANAQLISMSPPWYQWDHATNPDEAYIQKGDNIQTVEIDGNDRNVYVHDAMPGVAIIGRTDGNFNNDELRLIDDNDDCRVAYAASALFFDSPLDLRLWGGIFKGAREGFLVASAETIVFNRRVDIRYGWLGGGVLVLSVPDGLGIPGQEIVPATGSESKVVLNALYGKVYFSEFRVDGSSMSSISNKGFYFRKKSDGIVLFDDDSYNSAYNTLIGSGDLIPINTSVSKPDPEDCVTFFQY